jgi:hypothetical protein
MSTDPAAQKGILRLIRAQVETREAAAFLASIAEEASTPAKQGERYDDVSGPPQLQAIQSLRFLGIEGERTLHALHCAGRVREARSRAYLDTLAREGFRRRR